MLTTITKVSEDINDGKILFVAGDESQLKRLPKGKWIGGTIPYFMGENGGVVSKESVYSSEIKAPVSFGKISEYTDKNISSITKDACENGFSFIIIPATSSVHIAYAQDAPSYDNIFVTPVLGWISGVLLEDLGNVSPKVFNGETGQALEDKAVVMHCSLPADKMAQIGIVNVFRQGDGDSIYFLKKGFAAETCLVNGVETNFAKYVRDNNIDTKLPLVANYAGANVNVSIQDLSDNGAALYAPVFEEVEYKFAAPLANYVDSFKSALPQDTDAVFSCNCILNFLYSELEGKITKGMYGPITFGEVAYQLLNQTLVYLEIKDL